MPDSDHELEPGRGTLCSPIVLNGIVHTNVRTTYGIAVRLFMVLTAQKSTLKTIVTKTSSRGIKFLRRDKTSVNCIQ